MQGMAFGTGSAVAHRAVDAVAGPRTIHVDHGQQGEAAPAQQGWAGSSQNAAPDANACNDDLMNFQSCLRDNNNNMSQCKFFLDVLNTCQTNADENSKWR